MRTDLKNSKSVLFLYTNKPTMGDEAKIIEILKAFLDNLNNKSNTSNDAVAAIEVENEALRQEKFELLTKLNQQLRVEPRQGEIIKSLTSHLQGRKQAQAAAAEIISRRMKESSQRASEQIKLCKDRLRQTDTSVVLAYDNVVEKINEIGIKTENNHRKSVKLSEELKDQAQHLAELKKFGESLKQIENEQKKQLTKMRKTKT